MQLIDVSVVRHFTIILSMSHSTYHCISSLLSNSQVITPVIPSTEIDYAILRQVALKSFNEKNVIMPRNAIESQIEAVWREQLGSSSIISVKDSFFDLGGDSLKAGQLVNAMRYRNEGIFDLDIRQCY